MRSFRLNGWERIGVCATVIYLIALHVFVFLDAKSPPNRTVLDPARIRPSTVFHDWSVSSSSPPVSEQEFRVRKGLPSDYKLTEAEFFELLPDKWVHILRLRAYLCWLLVPPLLAWILSYAVVAGTKWIARAFHK